MKVVFVSTIERGGPLSHLRQLAPRVAEAGVDVSVICSNEAIADTFRAKSLDATVVPIGSKFDAVGAAALWGPLAGADVVHTHDRRAGLFARSQGRIRGAVPVHTLHGLPEEIAARLGRPDAPDPPGVSAARIAWLIHGYLRIESMLTALGHLVAPSQAMADFLIQHGFAAKRIEVIPYGIELLNPNGRVQSSPGEPFVLGTAANLEYWKGLDVLLEACARATSPTRLEIYGQGALRGELEQQAARLGVDARFHGFVGDLGRPFAALDAFVLPSRADNLPVAILEAMSAGLPVIGARTGGIPELVVDGQTGLLFEAENPDALAATIDDLAADGERRAKFGRLGRERVAAHFGAEEIGRRFVALYERLCGSST